MLNSCSNSSNCLSVKAVRIRLVFDSFNGTEYDDVEQVEVVEYAGHVDFVQSVGIGTKLTLICNLKEKVIYL